MTTCFSRFALSVALITALFASPLHANTIYLEFLTGTGSQYNYSTVEMEAIRARVAADYAPFGHTVTLSLPTSGSFSRIQINALTDFDGDALEGGVAQEIDFRNLNANDRARVNTAGFLTGAANTSANQIGLTATIASHETGHLMGLRHADSWGSIGNGLPTARDGTVVESDFFPVYPSGVPNLANETFTGIMASPGSVGQTIEEAVQDTFFNERSAVKLAFNNTGLVVNEIGGTHNTIATAQTLSLASLIVPNTIPQFIPGTATPTVNFGKIFDVSAITVLGDIDLANELDYFSFTAESNDLFNFEVLSEVPDTNGIPRYSNSVDTVINIFDSNGSLVPYYNGTAVNDDEWEGPRDSLLIDLVIPTTGTYYARINGFTTDTGNYELFMYRFEALQVSNVPEPSGMILGGLGLTVMLLTRRRRHP